MAKATLWTEFDDDHGIPVLCVRGPYKATFADQMKRDLPRQSRWFDQARKVWCVELAYRAVAEAIVREHFEEAVTAPSYDTRSEHEVLELRQQIHDLQSRLQHAAASGKSDPAVQRELRRLQTELVAAKAEVALYRAQHQRLREELGQAAKSAGLSSYDVLCGVLDASGLRKLHQLSASCAHPDRGGDLQTAQRVGEAWERIKKARGL